MKEGLFECLSCLIDHLEECLFGEDFNSPLQGHHVLEALPVHVQDLVIIETDGNFQTLKHSNLISTLQPFPSCSRALHDSLKSQITTEY